MAEEKAPVAAVDEAADATEENKATEEASAETVPPVKDMRCVVLTGFGGLKSVKVQQKPEPSVGAEEVLIRVKAW